jgi:hypothetical protein
MFLLDSLLLAPGKAVLFMFEELAKKAQEEFLDDDSVKQELQEIYMRLEGGTISEQEFETRELGLMQRLEQIARAKFEGNWGTSAMGLQRAFLQGQAPADGEMLLAEAIREAEILPAEPQGAPSLVGAGFSSLVGAGAEPLVGSGAEPLVAAGAPPLVAAGAPPLVAAGFSRLAAIDAAPEAPSLPVELPRPPVAPTPAVAAAPAPPVAPAALTMAQVVESTMRHMSMLKLKMSAVTAVSRMDDGWRVTAEMLERKAVPDTSDLLGVYDLQLDAAGNVLRYERTHMRRRSDLGR